MLNDSLLCQCNSSLNRIKRKYWLVKSERIFNDSKNREIKLLFILKLQNILRITVQWFKCGLNLCLLQRYKSPINSN